METMLSLAMGEDVLRLQLQDLCPLSLRAVDSIIIPEFLRQIREALMNVASMSVDSHYLANAHQ